MMAMDKPLLTQTTPTISESADVHISHVQLRDLVICPHKRGVLNYLSRQSIVEHDLNTPNSQPRSLADLSFTPNTLASLKVPGTDTFLLAAGGQEAEIHLSLHSGSRRPLWQYEDRLKASINNSVLLTSLSLTRSHESSVEPRMAVSNNDHTVKFFDIPVRAKRPSQLEEIGSIRLNVPVNHSSISPDGRTLLSVGDSSKVFLHRVTGGGRISFSPMATLSVPPPEQLPMTYSFSLAASFSTAFSSDGTKYAVASQDGVVAVWDVRSTKPFKVFQTDKSRLPSGPNKSNWLSDDPWEWTRGNANAPGWGVRNVKFGAGGCNGTGKEIMTFTEHTSLLHVVDARTFETEEIVRLPPASRQRMTQSRLNPNPLIPSRYVSPTSPVSRSSAAIHSPPPYIVLALEDTFRISAGRVALDFRARNGNPDPRSEEDVVVIPSFDVQEEESVHALLERESRRSPVFLDSDPAPAGTAEDEMDVDDSDCIPSRSSSPGPTVHIGVGTRISSGPMPPGRLTRRHWRPRTEDIQENDAESESSSDYRNNNSDSTEEDDVDIAGTCFDPDGGSIYVATTGYVAEWRVRGAEKRWWPDDAWLA